MREWGPRPFSIIAPDAGVMPMLGQRDPQATIFDGDQLYLAHVGERTLYSYLARHRHELFRDEDFAELYDAKLGRPSVPPSLLCVALLLQTYEKCSDAEAKDRRPMTSAGRWRWGQQIGRSRSRRARCSCSAPTCCSTRRRGCPSSGAWRWRRSPGTCARTAGCARPSTAPTSWAGERSGTHTT